MSRSGDHIVLIRDGQKQNYEEVWGNLYRELVWGPEAFETWTREGEEVDWDLQDAEDLSGLAIVNFDNQTLTWGTSEQLGTPKSQALLEKLVQGAWPGFKVQHLAPTALMTTADGGGEGLISLGDEEEYSDRPVTVREAAEYFLPDNESGNADFDDEDYEEEKPFSEDLRGAWISIADEQGDVRQCGLSRLPHNLLSNKENDLLEQLAALPATQIPEERYVTEGLWIDAKNQRLFYWGSDYVDAGRHLQSSWTGWTVTSATSGYARHCELCHLQGKAMSDAEALGVFLPQVLSTKRMSIENLLGAMGDSLKSFAAKATGCLTLVLAIPILLVGFFMNMWKEAGYAIATLIVLVVLAFKFVEFRLKSKFSASDFASKDEDLEAQRPATAGPLDEEQRKELLGGLLRACDMPALSEIEPHFDEDLEAFL